MTSERFKEIGAAMFCLLLLCSFIGGCFYFVLRTPQHKITNKNWCSKVIYYNTPTKTVDTTYCQSILYDDSLINFTSPNGSVWSRKDMIDISDRNVDYGLQRDITITDGEHFKVTPISDTACLIKSKMDSIKINNTQDDEPDDN